MLSYCKLRHLLWVVPVVAVALIAACGGSPSAPTAPVPSSDPAASAVPPAGPAAPTPGASGRLAVRITDSPFSDATALLITFSEISAHTSDGNWVSLPFAGGASTLTCDLKHLVNAQDMLGTGQLTAGHYTQLRLTVQSAEIYFNSTAVGADTAPCAAAMTLEPVIGSSVETGTPVDVPSGTVKLVREFDVTGSGTTTILLDFDGDKSVLKTGNGAYKMMPVIKVVSVQ